MFDNTPAIITERQLAIFATIFSIFAPIGTLYGINVEAFQVVLWIASPMLWVCLAYFFTIYAKEHISLPDRGGHAIVAMLTIIACTFGSMILWVFLTYFISDLVAG